MAQLNPYRENARSPETPRFDPSFAPDWDEAIVITVAIAAPFAMAWSIALRSCPGLWPFC